VAHISTSKRRYAKATVYYYVMWLGHQKEDKDRAESAEVQILQGNSSVTTVNWSISAISGGQDLSSTLYLPCILGVS